MPEEFTLQNIDDLIDYWRKHCDDVHPSNVDSMDRGNDVDECIARKAICMVPALLEELKAHMVRENEGHETELSKLAHSESRRWLKRLTSWWA
jgi:hypothetical protein